MFVYVSELSFNINVNFPFSFFSDYFSIFVSIPTPRVFLTKKKKIFTANKQIRNFSFELFHFVPTILHFAMFYLFRFFCCYFCCCCYFFLFTLHLSFLTCDNSFKSSTIHNHYHNHHHHPPSLPLLPFSFFFLARYLRLQTNFFTFILIHSSLFFIFSSLFLVFICFFRFVQSSSPARESLAAMRLPLEAENTRTKKKYINNYNHLILFNSTCKYFLF